VLRKEAQAAKIFSAFVAHRLAERLSTTAAQSDNARDLVGRFLHKSKAQVNISLLLQNWQAPIEKLFTE
jgi:hypothetical protein